MGKASDTNRKGQRTKRPNDQITTGQGTKGPSLFFFSRALNFSRNLIFFQETFFPVASRAEPFLRNRTCCNVLQPEPKVTGTRTKPTSYSDQDSVIVFTTLTSPHPESSVQFTSMQELPFRPIVINWHASLQGLGIS